MIEPVSSVFISVLCCGMRKPLNVHAYLDEIVHELRIILSKGMPTCVHIHLASIIADAPAKAVIKTDQISQWLSQLSPRYRF